MSTKDDLIAQLKIADSAVQNALSLAMSLPDDPATVITTPAQFDAAYAAASAGSSIVLDPTFVYPAPFVFDKSLVITAPGTVTARPTVGPPMPMFQGGIQVKADAASLLGIDVRNASLMDIIVISGAHHVNMGCRVLGDPVNGGKRGIAGNAPDVTISKAYIADIFLTGQDTQAFCAWDSPGPFHIDDCFMSASGETVLFGGADASSATNIPSDILLTNSTLTKDPTWQTKGYQVKNVLEFKAARRAKVQNCDLSYSWSGYSQDGYMLVLTPRNQDGTAPFTLVDSVTIDRCIFRNAAAWCQMLGSDYTNPSGWLSNITLSNNTVSALDPSKWTANGSPASDKMILVQTQNGGPKDVHIFDNVCAGVNIGSVLYFASGDNTKANTFNFNGNHCPSSTYGIMGGGTSPDLTLNNASGLTWTTFVASGAPSGNTTGA